MRLTPYLAICAAGLASAAPLSIIVTTTSEAVTYRLGKPVHDAKSAGAMRMGAPPTRMRQACNKMQGGVAKLFALAGLGPAMPSDMEAFVELAPEHHTAHDHAAHMLLDGFRAPPAQSGNPNWPPHAVHPSAIFVDGQGRIAESRVPPPSHHHGHFRHRLHRGSFVRRIHRALMSLGPWEGRAVAFVLGCGIGVILRMLWILVVVTKRAVRGESEADVDEAEYERVGVVLPAEDGEALFLAPPEYSADEKTSLPEDAKI